MVTGGARLPGDAAAGGLGALTAARAPRDPDSQVSWANHLGTSRLRVWVPGLRSQRAAPRCSRGGARARAGASTHLRHTSGTGRGSATHCPGPQRTRCKRRRIAAGWTTAAAFSPWLRSSARTGPAPPPRAQLSEQSHQARRPAPARPGGGPAPQGRPLSRFLIANLINCAPVGGARLVNG